MILVVGSTGSLGCAVALKLAQAGKPVSGLVRDPASAKARTLHESGVTLIPGDLTRPETLEPALAEAETVICTATAMVSRGSGNLLDAVDNRGVQSLITAAEQDATPRHFVYYPMTPPGAPTRWRWPSGPPSGVCGTPTSAGPFCNRLVFVKCGFHPWSVSTSLPAGRAFTGRVIDLCITLPWTTSPMPWSRLSGTPPPHAEPFGSEAPLPLPSSMPFACGNAPRARPSPASVFPWPRSKPCERALPTALGPQLVRACG